MRILFATENYFPMVSGVPVVVKYLAEGLVNRGHEVMIVTQQPNGTLKNETLNGVDIKRFSLWKDWKHSYQGDIKEYVNYVINNNSDLLILECTECITTDLLLPYLASFQGRIIFHAHGMSGLDNRFFQIKDSLKHTIGSTYNWVNSKIYFNCKFKKALTIIDAFMFLSPIDSGVEYVQSQSCKTYILPNAADQDFFQKEINENSLFKYALIKNGQYFLSCANYTDVKNQKELIRQYFESDSSLSTSLICIGSCDNKYYYECQHLLSKLKKKYGFRDVHLLYNVKREDISSIVNGALLYLVSSRWEQYSISMIEAMARGVPYISTNVGCASLLPGGMVINHVKEMSRNIDALLRNTELYRQYSIEGRLYANENNKVNKVIDKLETIISEVCI